MKGSGVPGFWGFRGSRVLGVQEESEYVLVFHLEPSDPSHAEITSEAPPQTDEPVVSYDIPVNVNVNVIVIVIVDVDVDVDVDVHDHG